MIIDNSNDRLAEIKAFAKEHSLEESFNNTFSRLENYSDKDFDVTLYSDFAPLSLEFIIKQGESFVLMEKTGAILICRFGEAAIITTLIMTGLWKVF